MTKENYIQLISQVPIKLSTIPEELQKDNDFYLQVIERTDPLNMNLIFRYVFSYYDHHIPEEIFVAAIKKDSLVYMFGHDSYTSNIDYVKIAIKNNSLSYGLLPNFVKLNTDIVMLAVLQNEKNSQKVYSYYPDRDKNITDPYKYYQSIHLKNELEQQLQEKSYKNKSKI